MLSPTTRMIDELADKVNRAKGGDASAFADLVGRYKNAVAAVALAQVRDADLSQDIAQNAFVQAWRHLASLRWAQSFGPWLLELTRKEALMMRRTDQRKKQRDQRWHDVQPVLVPDAESVAVERSRLSAMLQALEEIPLAEREALVLYYCDGEATEQVAERLGLSEAAVRKRLQRARETLRDRLDGPALRVAAPVAAFVALVMASVRAEAAAPVRKAGIAASGLAVSIGVGGLVVLLVVGAFALPRGQSAATSEASKASASPQHTSAKTSHWHLPFISPAATAPSGASIGGRVSWPDGKPVPAAVLVTTREQQTVASTTTDENGTFLVEGLAPDVYELLVQHPAEERRQVRIVLGANDSYFAEIHLDALQQPLTGRLVDSGGAPLAGREIFLHNPSEAPDATVVTDADGSFSLPRGFPRTQVNVVVGPANEKLDRPQVAQTLSAMNVKVLESPEPSNAVWASKVRVGANPIELVIPATGRIQGTVPRGGFEAIHVMNVDAGYAVITPLQVSADAHFVADLPAGNYALAAAPFVQTEILVRAGEEQIVSFPPAAPHAPPLKVKVIMPDGSPAAGAEMEWRTEQTEAGMRIGEGHARTNDVGEGSLVRTSPPSAGTVWAIRDGASAHVAVPVGETAITVQLGAPGRIIGHIHGQRGGGAGIIADDGRPGWWSEFRRFDSEDFVIDHVPPGEVRVRVYSADRTVALVAATVRSGQDTAVEVSLGDMASVRGRAAGFEMVSVLGQSYSVGADGSFVIAALPAGDHALLLQRSDGSEVTKMFSIAAGETLDLGDL